MLFSDVSDSSHFAEVLEAEDYAELLHSFRARTREIIPRHGGSIARLQGDGVLALFGHLQPREDDGRRAAEAALELHAAVARLRVDGDPGATRMQMHSGIHAGLVLLLPGDIETGRYDVVGEVPNTAARLCSLAAGGELVVSDESLGPHAHFFEVGLRRHMAVRGRSQPLTLLTVTGRAAVARRIDASARRGVVPFVGRAGPLRQLLAAAQQARSGGVSPLRLTGEPGVGKTRLLDEFERSLAPNEFIVVRGYCESYLGAEPLQPFMQMLRRALGLHGDVALADADAQLQQGLVGLGLAADAAELVQARARLGTAVVAPLAPDSRVHLILRLLGLVARSRTAVLVLDDWQWADDASHTVLQALLQQPGRRLVVLAERSGEIEPDLTLQTATVLDLQPLSAQAGEAVVSAWLPEADAFLVQEIVRLSGGSPLFIEELCHQAAAGGDIGSAAQTRGSAWINALAASRLERLPAAQAETLQMASVAGMVFPLWLLQGLAGAVPAALQDEGLAGFLSLVDEGRTVRFRHQLTREAVYATVELGQRRNWHLRVAQLLEARAGDVEGFEPLEALAYHFDAAGSSEQAARYAEAAGDRALAAMALDRARGLFMLALQALDARPALSRPMALRWCGIAQKLGQTCVFDPLDVSYGLRMFERAAQLARQAEDVNALARAEYWLGYVNYGRGRPLQAVRWSEAALAHARESGDERLTAQVLATLGQALASAGSYGRAIPLLRTALDSKRKQSRPGSGIAIGSAYSLGRLGYTLGDLGRFDEAAACFEQAFELLGGAVHSVAASVHELVCAVHLWQGRWADARQAGFTGAQLALQCRSRYLTAMGRALGSCGAWALDGNEAALRELRESTHWIEVRGGAVSTSLNQGWLVEASASLGRWAQMRQHAAQLFLRARVHDTHGWAQGCRALAKAAAAGAPAATRGRPSRVQHYLALADQAAAHRGSAREVALNLLARADVALLQGARLPAREQAEQAARAFEALGMQWHLQRALTLLG